METVSINKKVPLCGEYDIIVAGGGPAGIAAAISAAREGASVLLVERLGNIGGNLTSGHVCPILGQVSDGTFFDEIVRLLTDGNPESITLHTRNGLEIPIDFEDAKIKLTRLLVENRVKIMLFASVVDVIAEGGRVGGIIVNTPSGLEAYRAKAVIDATGDGQVAYLAGSSFSYGRESDGRVQPVSLLFTVAGVDESRGITAWGGSDPVKLPDGKEYRVLCREKNEAGELPQNVTIVRLHRTCRQGERSVNATQLNGINPLDSLQLGYAEYELRGQIADCIRFLQRYVPGYENCYLKDSASVVGVRESRRIHGDYTVCDRDVEEGVMHPDSVVVHNAWFLIDIHNPSGGGQAEGFAKIAKAYDIPYGALLPVSLEGIICAGRCISGTHRAHASYRVMAICLAMGEAAGIAAALAAAKNTTPRALGARAVQEVLISRGVKLFD